MPSWKRVRVFVNVGRSFHERSLGLSIELSEADDVAMQRMEQRLSESLGVVALSSVDGSADGPSSCIFTISLTRSRHFVRSYGCLGLFTCFVVSTRVPELVAL